MDSGAVEGAASAVVSVHEGGASEATTTAALRAALDAAPVAVIASDASGRVVVANAAALRLFGRGTGELTGERAEALLTPRFRAAYAEELAARTDRRGSCAAGAPFVAEALAAGPEGNTVTVEVWVGAVETDAGVLATTALRDVGGERRTVADLEMARADLEAFRHTVAHDLRAPARNVAAFARLLSEGHASKLDEEGKDWLHEVRDGADRMCGFIEALLELSNVTRASLRRVSVDVTELARALLERRARAEPNRAVVWTVEDGLSAELDPLLARTMLDALLGNAWKFTSARAPAHVEVGATEVGGERAFFVRDDGAGFDASYVHKLFSPFQRLHAATEFPGAGMGLAIVRRIVVRHGGRVWAEGRPGGGATFFFIVPEARS